jgi:aspartate-semialdehyde dehydrogenase
MAAKQKIIDVAVAGATGTVGQKFIVLLKNHPMFRIKELVASDRSAGKKYHDACSWKQEIPIPEEYCGMKVKSSAETLDSPVIFSGLDSSVAGEIEKKYAEDGHTVFSNAKNHRMEPDVPLIIPEINPGHFELVKHQRYKGAIITNSNCSTMFLAMVLAPLHRRFTVEAVIVSTMQAVSGAGYPGVASLDILGNVVPYISGEEEKVERESQKILGTLSGDRIEPAPFPISAHCNRVPVIDGHTETISVKLSDKPAVDEVRDALSRFSGLPQQLRLPSAPEAPIIVFPEHDRPQPRLDIRKEAGMCACVGRIRSCPIFDMKMVIMGHNTVRGAAGAAILNAETYEAQGYLSR